VTRAFEQAIAHALGDASLAEVLGRFSDDFQQARARAYAGIDFEALRDRIVALKGDAAGRLEELAAEFTRQAQARGAMVLRAHTPAEARAMVLELAQQRGVRRVVKSKSMASEEIALNAHLEQAGLEVDETDLGEWIVQLAHQRPSHMIMPAIHLRREQVARTFSHHLATELPPDIPRLVETARQALRPKLLAADMGISGANIAVAETGSLVIVSNEGNARLVSTLPRLHLALVGIEKLVARLSDVAPILQALPRSATAQLMSSYVSIISGATPGADRQPKELVVVLLDHRRLELGADPEFAAALRCIRCACCLNVCPVFRLVGGHVFGHVYTGGIGAILTAWFDTLERSADMQTLCIGCGRCRELCPARIDVPELILGLRQRLARRPGAVRPERALFALMRNRTAFHALLRTAALAQKPFVRSGLIRHLPLGLAGLTRHRSLPAIAEVPFRKRFAALPQPEAPRATAVLFAGCLLDFVYPELGEAIVRLLARAGIRSVLPAGQLCCGAPARYAGAWDEAADIGIANLQALGAEAADWVVSACPTCTVALRRDLAPMLERAGRHEWLEPAARLGAKVIDVGSLLLALVRSGRLRFTPRADGRRVTYHDSCHLGRTLGATAPPRELLRAAGFELVEMSEPGACCGMGGSYSLEQPEISAAILRRKLDDIRATDAPLVATDCPGCLLQLRGGCDGAKLRVAAKHTLELLLAQLAPEGLAAS
jgi:L-lactate dehydrogenase complex protein LldF